MPSRILREGIIHSDLIDALSPGAELLYRRLMSVVDDYGRFYASPATVRGACWPKHPEKVTEQQVGEWLAECAGSDGNGPLLRIYVSGTSKYLEIIKFEQGTRSKSKFPAPCEQEASNPESVCKQSASNLQADCSQNVRPIRISNFEVRSSTAAAAEAENGSPPNAKEPQPQQSTETAEPPPLEPDDEGWPETRAALGGMFPLSDSVVVNQIIQAARKAEPDIGDEALAELLSKSKKSGQNSAGLFVRTIPAALRNGKARGRDSPAHASAVRLRESHSVALDLYARADAETRAELEKTWPELSDKWPKGG